MSDQAIPYVPGLAGVPAAQSAVSWIDGAAGILEYRGHRIETLAERSNFEEVAWLLYHGTLPTRAQLDGLRARLARRRPLSDGLMEVVRRIPREASAMGKLQLCLALLGVFCPEVPYGDEEAFEDAWVRILAATPVMVATCARLRQGLEPVAPDPELDTAANFLWCLDGERPDEVAARTLDVALVLHADHTMNASTFTARVIASAQSDPYASCSGAVGTLKGPLHGGANERALRMLEEIGRPEDVVPWVERTLAAKGKVMGFGHRVYKTKDPRSLILQAMATKLFETLGTTPAYETALALEKEMLARVGAKGIYPNVDFFSGIVYSRLGIPTEFFTPIFGISRVAGYLAHLREQMQDNRIYRPKQVFTGSHGAVYVPIDERG